MAYGASIKSYNGDLLIDDTYDTYVYLGTYTLTFISKETNWETASTNPSWNPHFHDAYCDIVSTTRPIVFFKPPLTSDWSWTTYPAYNQNPIPGMALVSVLNIGGNTWRARFATTTSGGSSSVKAFAAVKSKGASTVTNGIRLYNASSNLIFDSGWKILNPTYKNTSLNRLQATNTNVIGGSITLDASTTYHDSYVPRVGDTKDNWVSVYTREPNIFIRLGSRPYTATFGFQAFSTVSEYSNTEYSIISWNACWNSTDISYSSQVGSTSYTTTSFLIVRDMGVYFP